MILRWWSSETSCAWLGNKGGGGVGGYFVLKFPFLFVVLLLQYSTLRF